MSLYGGHERPQTRVLANLRSFCLSLITTTYLSIPHLPSELQHRHTRVKTWQALSPALTVTPAGHRPNFCSLGCSARTKKTNKAAISGAPFSKKDIVKAFFDLNIHTGGSSVPKKALKPRRSRPSTTPDANNADANRSLTLLTF
jgi:hypothetical protein